MSLAVSARDMISLARGAAGAETLDQANAFVTDTEALAVLNTELAELDDLIIENHDDAYHRGSENVSLEAGTSIYPLGVGVYKLISVDINWSADVIRSAKRFNEAERNRFRNIQPSWSQFGRVYYRPYGASNIEFIPTPLAPVTATVHYVTTFSPLLALTDTYESHNGWHMAAVWGLAMYIRMKDDDEVGASLASQQKDRQRARVVSMAGSRVDAEPPRVQRTRHFDEEDDF